MRVLNTLRGQRWGRGSVRGLDRGQEGTLELRRTRTAATSGNRDQSAISVTSQGALTDTDTDHVENRKDGRLCMAGMMSSTGGGVELVGELCPSSTKVTSTPTRSTDSACTVLVSTSPILQVFVIPPRPTFLSGGPPTAPARPSFCRSPRAHAHELPSRSTFPRPHRHQAAMPKDTTIKYPLNGLIGINKVSPDHL